MSNNMSKPAKVLIKGCLKGRSPFKTQLLPLSCLGEGDKGGEVDK